MLALQISIVAVVVGILMAVIYNNSKSYSELIEIASGVLIALGSVFTLCFGVAGLVEQLRKDTGYQNALYERSVLVYRMENEELSGNEMLYTQIMEFNNELRTIKRWSENTWVGMLYNEKIATIDYIEIPGVCLE